MDAGTVLLLGALQGLTEFLPISSSGHLVVAQHVFGVKEPSLYLEVLLHLGTLAAVLGFFWRDFAALSQGLRTRGAGPNPGGLDRQRALRFLALLGLATLPAAVAGLLMRADLARLSLYPAAVGGLLVVNGGLLFATRRWRGAGDLWEVSWGAALGIGCAQAVALLPGISRSGATIAAALAAGMGREAAGRFSFLLAVPAMLGAAGVEFLTAPPPPSTPWTLLAAGTGAAFLTGLAALALLFRLLRRGRLDLFAPYCWLLGAGVVLATWLG